MKRIISLFLIVLVFLCTTASALEALPGKSLPGIWVIISARDYTTNKLNGVDMTVPSITDGNALCYFNDQNQFYLYMKGTLDITGRYAINDKDEITLLSQTSDGEPCVWAMGGSLMKIDNSLDTYMLGITHYDKNNNIDYIVILIKISNEYPSF